MGTIADDDKCVAILADALAARQPVGQGDALDLDRVLSLADVHAEESREDGVRLPDRGGLLPFAQDVAAALAARQPVVSNQLSGNSGALDVDAARQPVGDQHPDDLAVDEFAAAMKAKMAAARAKGRGGWEDPAQCTAEDLSRMLREHVEKGDPRDVANFCMMLHQRGEAIAARQPVGESAIDYEDLVDQAKDLIQCGCSVNGAFDWLLEQLTDGEVLASPAQAVDLGPTFQAGVAEWMGQCFLPSLYSNMTERGDRLLEEVLELLQAHGYDRARVPTLVDYVFGRPVGEPVQEVGGVMVTLAGYCWVAGLDMHAAGDAELARISQPEVMAKIRAKQEAKNALHFDTPLPGNADASVPAQAVDLADFKALYRAYVRLLESGRDRILDLGGTCDPVDVMEANDVDLQAARRVLDSQAVGNG
ncbi:hypothetical protein I5W42_05725 [Stenotrophomonas maltophilia]|nr:hypothetical protein [Stenotrophomonas maltophilia]